MPTQLEQDPERLAAERARTTTATSTVAPAPTPIVYRPPDQVVAPTPAPAPAPTPTYTAPKTTTPTPVVYPKPDSIVSTAPKVTSPTTVYRPPDQVVQPAPTPTQPAPAPVPTPKPTAPAPTPVYRPPDRVVQPSPTPAPAPTVYKPPDQVVQPPAPTPQEITPVYQPPDRIVSEPTPQEVTNPYTDTGRTTIEPEARIPLYERPDLVQQQVEAVESPLPPPTQPAPTEYVIDPRSFTPQFTLNELDPLEREQYLATPGGSPKYWAELDPTDFTRNIEAATPVASGILVVGGIFAAPLFLPISAVSLALGTGIGVGISEGISYGTTGKFLEPAEVPGVALQSMGLTLLGVGALAGVAKVGSVGARVAGSVWGRAGINAALGAGTNVAISEVSYQQSRTTQLRNIADIKAQTTVEFESQLSQVARESGYSAKELEPWYAENRARFMSDIGAWEQEAIAQVESQRPNLPLEAAKGAALGAGMSLGTELVAMPLVNELRARLPTRLGGVTRLEEGLPTTGKSGEPVSVYESKPLEELGGRKLRLVADVTENPIQNVDDAIQQYVGKRTPTGHATLEGSKFNLEEGGVTTLKGFPRKATGFRASEELYHFYSAPGSEEAVTAYGGYAGVGEDYSTSRIRIGGKPTVIATLDTEVSPSFVPIQGESQTEFLGRISRLSGQTGIAPETVLGYSTERQLVTPAQYTRGGEVLPGSQFVSSGKLGTFQIRQGFKYTNVTVVGGEFRPVSGYVPGGAPAVDLDVGAYNQARSIPTRSVSVAPAVVPAPFIASIPRSKLTPISTPVVAAPSPTPSQPSIPSRTSLSESVFVGAVDAVPKPPPAEATPMSRAVEQAVSAPDSTISSRISRTVAPVPSSIGGTIQKSTTYQPVSVPSIPKSGVTKFSPTKLPESTLPPTPTPRLPSPKLEPSPMGPLPQEPSPSFPSYQRNILPTPRVPTSESLSPKSEPAQTTVRTTLEFPEDKPKYQYYKPELSSGWFPRRKPILTPEQMWEYGTRGKKRKA